MPIATSRQYVATGYGNLLELWDPIKRIRTTHELAEELVVIKVECYGQGGVALTSSGKVIFFTAQDRHYHPTAEFITDISSGERDLVMATKSGRFLYLGKKASYLRTAPPPIQVSVGAAKVAYLSNGKLYVDDQHIFHDCSVIQVAVGGGHTLFLDEKEQLYGFGNNQSGQLGRGLVEYTSTPIHLPFFGSPEKIGAGLEHSVVLDKDGVAWVTGANHHGQLGPDISTLDHCRYGFVRLREGVLDICARGNVTILDLRDGNLESIGERY